MAIDPGFAALLTAAVVTPLSLAGKLFYDAHHLKNEAKQGDTENQRAQTDAYRATIEAAKAYAAAASEWMEKYQDLVDKMAVVREEMVTVRVEMAQVKTQMVELREAKAQTDADLSAARGEILRLTGEVARVSQERDEYKRGYQSALVLMEANAAGKGDEGILSVAETHIRALMRYEADLSNRPAGPSPPPAETL